MVRYAVGEVKVEAGLHQVTALMQSCSCLIFILVLDKKAEERLDGVEVWYGEKY